MKSHDLANLEEKIIEQAEKSLENFGINWAIYGEPKVQSTTGENLIHEQWFVTWTNIHNKKITVSNITIDQNGNIHTGDNDGDLVL